MGKKEIMQKAEPSSQQKAKCKNEFKLFFKQYLFDI